MLILDERGSTRVVNDDRMRVPAVVSFDNAGEDGLIVSLPGSFPSIRGGVVGEGCTQVSAEDARTFAHMILLAIGDDVPEEVDGTPQG